MYLEYFEAGWYKEDPEREECFQHQRQDRCPWEVLSRVLQCALGTFGLSLKRGNMSVMEANKGYKHTIVSKFMARTAFDLCTFARGPGAHFCSRGRWTMLTPYY
jgi:hypothetical protein